MNGDLEILDHFLSDLDELLQFAFESRTTFMSQNLATLLADAWPSYKRRMESLRSSLAALAPEEIGLLTFHGLTGPELRLKMAGFNEAVDDFRGYRDLPEREPAILSAKLRRGLEWGNVILPSLPIPGKGAIEEIKRVVERAIKDSEDPWRTKVPSIVPR